MLIQILLPFCLLFEPAIPCDTAIKRTSSKFIVPDWGKKLTLAYGCRTGPPAYVYVAWWAGTTTLCQS